MVTQNTEHETGDVEYRNVKSKEQKRKAKC